MANPFLTRLRLLTRLNEDELAALAQLFDARRPVRARANLIAEGERPERLHVLLDGWACRYKLLADGRRQIAALLVPGDLCDLDSLHLRQSDFAVAAITSCTVASASAADVRELATRQPAIADALGRLGAIENAMLAEHNTCLGRRSAREHVAHLLCELLVRLSAVGRADDRGFTLPVTQEEMADVLGLTAVHVNRVLQSMRAEGLIELRGSELEVRDWDALRQLAAFRPNYLHLDGASRNDAAAARALSAAPLAGAGAAHG